MESISVNSSSYNKRVQEYQDILYEETTKHFDVIEQWLAVITPIIIKKYKTADKLISNVKTIREILSEKLLKVYNQQYKRDNIEINETNNGQDILSVHISELIYNDISYMLKVIVATLDNKYAQDLIPYVVNFQLNRTAIIEEFKKKNNNNNELKLIINRIDTR